MDLLITNFTKEHLQAVKTFTDQHIGFNYYSLDQLVEIIDKSTLGSFNASFLLFKNHQLCGIRLSYMPGKWQKVKGEGGLTPEKWPYRLEEMGYFQSLFILPELTGKNWGGKLSNLSLEAIKAAGGRGVLTHSWMESPNNSSQKYLKKLGFKLISLHPLYWHKVDYDCPLCGRPCVCSAGEMFLDLENP